MKVKAKKITAATLLILINSFVTLPLLWAGVVGFNNLPPYEVIWVSSNGTVVFLLLVSRLSMIVSGQSSQTQQR